MLPPEGLCALPADTVKTVYKQFVGGKKDAILVERCCIL